MTKLELTYIFLKCGIVDPDKNTSLINLVRFINRSISKLLLGITLNIKICTKSHVYNPHFIGVGIKSMKFISGNCMIYPDLYREIYGTPVPEVGWEQKSISKYVFC